MKWQPYSLKLLFAFVVIIVMSKCEKEKGSPSTKPLPAVVSFTRDIQPFFSSTCANPSCHSGSSPKSGLDLSDSLVSYNNLFTKHEINTLNPTASNLYIFMNSNMPPSGKVPYDLALVLKWIDQGAKNN